MTLKTHKEYNDMEEDKQIEYIDEITDKIFALREEASELINHVFELNEIQGSEILEALREDNI